MRTSSRRRLGAGFILGCALLGLAGCGGQQSSGSAAQVRVVNLATDVARLDVTLDDANLSSSVAVDTATEYKDVDPDTYELEVLGSSTGSSLHSSSRTFAKEQRYSLVAWGRESALKLSALLEDDDESAIASGKAHVRVFNATSEVGALDAYLTRTDASLDDSTATAAGVGSAGLSGTATLDSGSWRLRVTGTGDSGDLRLDIPSITLPDRKSVTVVLTAGSGGVLVHATVLVQAQSGLTPLRNTQARLRVVAGVETKGAVGVAWKGSTVTASLRSPAVAAYTLVEAGQNALELRVNGVVASSGTGTLAAGADYTLLAWGDPAAAQLSLLTDDNRLPSSSSRAKLRLVHGAASAAALTLSLNYAALITDLAPGAASAFVTPSVVSDARMDVSALSSADTLYEATAVDLQSLGVYTLFVLGGNAAPTGVLRKDR